MPVKQSDSLQRTFADPLNPTFVGGSFPTAAARLGAAQARNPDTLVYQQDTGDFYALQPLHLCFQADGVTQATNRGTWGTLNAHWVKMGAAAAPANVLQYGDYDAANSQFSLLRDAGVPDDAEYEIILDELPVSSNVVTASVGPTV